MLKSNLKKKGTRAITLMGATALAGSLITVAAPQAMAYDGVEDPGTGIVWGVGSDGTYMVPVVGGGEMEGWCIDPGAPFPKQNGGTTYGEPQPWGGHLDITQRKQLILALGIGKAVTDNAIPPQLYDIARFANVDIGNQNDIAAGVSGVIHKVGGEASDNRGRPFDENRLSGSGKNVYDLIMQYAPMIPDQVDGLVSLSIRNPENASYQRMIVMNDITLPSLPEIILPNIDIPNIEVPPTGTGTTLPNEKTPTATETEKTTTPKEDKPSKSTTTVTESTTTPKSGTTTTRIKTNTATPSSSTRSTKEK